MPEFYFPRHAENATQLCGSDPDVRQLFGDCNHNSEPTWPNVPPSSAKWPTSGSTPTSIRN